MILQTIRIRKGRKLVERKAIVSTWPNGRGELMILAFPVQDCKGKSEQIRESLQVVEHDIFGLIFGKRKAG